MIPPDLGSRCERRQDDATGSPGPRGTTGARDGVLAARVTTDSRGALVARDSILGQPRAGSAREAIFRPAPPQGALEGARWEVGATMRDTQADVPSA